MYFNLSELIDYEADAAKICQEYGGFCEIDLNSGCPSPLVSSRCFGARLMLDPERVRDICKSMIQGVEDADVVENKAVVTVKCRIGVDDFESYVSNTSLLPYEYSTNLLCIVW
jgi:tRNA-dihydrouridine synthase